VRPPKKSDKQNNWTFHPNPKSKIEFASKQEEVLPADMDGARTSDPRRDYTMPGITDRSHGREYVMGTIGDSRARIIPASNKAEHEKRVTELKVELDKLKSSGVLDSDEVAEAIKGATEGDPKEIEQVFKKSGTAGARFSFNFGPPKSGSGFSVGDGYVVTTA